MQGPSVSAGNCRCISEAAAEDSPLTLSSPRSVTAFPLGRWCDRKNTVRFGQKSKSVVVGPCFLV